jgi:hypothetical protein
MKCDEPFSVALRWSESSRNEDSVILRWLGSIDILDVRVIERMLLLLWSLSGESDAVLFDVPVAFCVPVFE